MPSIPKASLSVNGGTYFMGVDPGINGGIAVISSTGRLAWAEPMPGTQADIWLLVHHRLLGPEGIDLDVRACVECINPAAFGWDKSANSKLYGSYRELTMVLTACEIPFETPQAKKWQAALSIIPRKKNEGDSKWKNRLRAKASQLFPGFGKGITKERALKVCDAILIAEFCRRLHNVR